MKKCLGGKVIGLNIPTHTFILDILSLLSTRYASEASAVLRLVYAAVLHGIPILTGTVYDTWFDTTQLATYENLSSQITQRPFQPLQSRSLSPQICTQTDECLVVIVDEFHELFLQGSQVVPEFRAKVGKRCVRPREKEVFDVE